MSEATSSSSKAQSVLKTWTGRLLGIVFGVGMAWLLVEVLLRVFFFSLPPRLQLILNDVHTTPFSNETLMPAPIWEPDTKYQTHTRPVRDHKQFGSAAVRFHVTTYAFEDWPGVDTRVAFRLDHPTQYHNYIDAVAVGDSFTFCFTDLHDCWVHRLEQQTGWNILNLGITSTGSLSHLRVLRGFGIHSKPPVVLWQWFGNDANEDYGMATSLDPSLQLPDDPPPESVNSPPAAPQQNWWDRNSALYVVAKMLLGHDDEFEAAWQFLDREQAQRGDIDLAFGRPYLWGAFDMSLPQNAYGWRLSQRAILEARNQLAAGYTGDPSQPGTLVIILIPTKEQVYRNMASSLIEPEKMALLDENYQMMQDFCAQNDLICLDPLPVFQAHAAAGEQLYYKIDIHLNPRGNQVLAEFLAQELATITE